MTSESSAFEKVVERAWEDDEFKAEFLRNPKSVLEQEMGCEIPEGLDVQVLEDTLTTRHLILPRQGATPQNEEIGQPELDPLSLVIDKAVGDTRFRERLISNPKATIEEDLGVSLPEDVEIRVLEQQDDVRYFVIPVSPEWEEGETAPVPEGWFKKVKLKTFSITICVGVC